MRVFQSVRSFAFFGIILGLSSSMSFADGDGPIQDERWWYNDDNSVTISLPRYSYQGREYRFSKTSDDNAICQLLTGGRSEGRTAIQSHYEDIYITQEVKLSRGLENQDGAISFKQKSKELAISRITCSFSKPSEWPRPHQLSMMVPNDQKGDKYFVTLVAPLVLVDQGFYPIVIDQEHSEKEACKIFGFDESDEAFTELETISNGRLLANKSENQEALQSLGIPHMIYSSSYLGMLHGHTFQHSYVARIKDKRISLSPIGGMTHYLWSVRCEASYEQWEKLKKLKESKQGSQVAGPGVDRSKDKDKGCTLF